MAVYTVQDVVQAIQDVVGAVTGIRAAPDYPPDSLGNLPAAITYAREGFINTGPFGIAESLHNIVIEIHFQNSDLPKAVKTAMPYVDSIPAALTANPWLANTCETFSRISYAFGAMEWGGIQTTGIRFVIEGIKLFPTGKI
jgi:hypothetical protein